MPGSGGKFAALLGALMLLAAHGAAAQPYCANYSDGSKNCGIPTLESCQQSLSGVGGECVTDTSAQLPAPLIQRPFQRAFGDPETPSMPSPFPGPPMSVPPPPDE